MIPVIISGGFGSRLWPVSRQNDPKPFLKLADGYSLLQSTFKRASNLKDVDTIITVTNEKLHFRMQDEYQQVNTNHLRCDFILEPFGRNTGPAVAVASLFVAQNYSPDDLILILPADHLITDFDKFTVAVETAKEVALQGFIATFGINPEYPETGYGYVEANINEIIAAGTYMVKRFIEKPNLNLAIEYAKSKNYLWNSGMLCAKASTLINELDIHKSALLKSAQKSLSHSFVSNLKNNTIVYLDSKLFLLAEDISIDYALLENTEKAAVIPCSIGWSDVGSWLSIAQTLPKDLNNNATIGENILHNVKNCLIYSTSRIIAGVNIENLVIVDTPDAVLIADKEYSQNVKIIFERLKKMEHKTSELHQTSHRPWGTYTILEDGPLYKVKRIEVKPGASLSLQLHNHRSEHWIVVNGIATVTNGEQTFELKSNESTYIPLGFKHRLENKTTETLILIEVQCGTYLGEDDIIRFEDKYGRTK